jgi:hypothetical protein
MNKMDDLSQRKLMYKEAQAAPPPFRIGGIITECGSCTHDHPSARPPPPSPVLWGGRRVVFFM